uniref:ribosomal protein L9 n=1 Tax=Pseudoerythrocladia kornmannii TaxID=753682 RepID=UPI001BEF37F2|nr:ribosomal protein L9 [Pseudoerythrocladia kornmannii]QUE28322.1 ribosomal protein L9 [Pseudoerythrocladia kornmannii]UNJ16826.1 ribosomal protein L9 [Pseudoerythrocladia kornmannii]
MSKKNIRILLLKDIETLGNIGTISSVPLGYARNFLIPEGLACLVTPGIQKNVEQNLAKQKEKELQAVEEAKAISNIIEEIKTFTIKKKVGKDDLIFGSITNQEVSELISTKIQQNIEKKNITVPNVKETGVYNVVIKLHSKVETSINLQVLPDDN